jgi:hypothetical protein
MQGVSQAEESVRVMLQLQDCVQSCAKQWVYRGGMAEGNKEQFNEAGA